MERHACRSILRMPAFNSHACAVGCEPGRDSCFCPRRVWLSPSTKPAERRLANRMGGADPVGAHLDRLLPHDQVEYRMAIVRQVASTGMHRHAEMQVRSRWFECWYYPVIPPDKPVSEVALYAREITEQKKSQAELSKLFQAIQQSPTSVVITDGDGNIEYVNPKFTDVTGYTQAEAIGQNPRILKSGHTSPEQYVELWKTITSGGVWRGEFHNKKKNGELFWSWPRSRRSRTGRTSSTSSPSRRTSPSVGSWRSSSASRRRCRPWAS